MSCLVQLSRLVGLLLWGGLLQHVGWTWGGLCSVSSTWAFFFILQLVRVARFGDLPPSELHLEVVWALGLLLSVCVCYEAVKRRNAMEKHVWAPVETVDSCFFVVVFFFMLAWLNSYIAWLHLPEALLSWWYGQWWLCMRCCSGGGVAPSACWLVVAGASPLTYWKSEKTKNTYWRP